MNDENLKSQNKRTKNEQREIAKKGGIASGISRKRSKCMKQVFRMVKDLPVQDEKIKKQLQAVGIDDADTT